MFNSDSELSIEDIDEKLKKTPRHSIDFYLNELKEMGLIVESEEKPGYFEPTGIGVRDLKKIANLPFVVSLYGIGKGDPTDYHYLSVIIANEGKKVIDQYKMSIVYIFDHEVNDISYKKKNTMDDGKIHCDIVQDNMVKIEYYDLAPIFVNENVKRGNLEIKVNGKPIDEIATQAIINIYCEEGREVVKISSLKDNACVSARFLNEYGVIEKEE